MSSEKRRGVGQIPDRAALLRDAVAGLNGALNSVPDGLASGVLAGVNPVYGLYAAMVGPVAGAAFSSTGLLVITTTSVASLAAGEALTAVSPAARDDALFVMVLLIGAFQILLGLLRAGRLARFISLSVMTGFLSRIAVLTIVSQLPTITGYQPGGGSQIAQTFDVLASYSRAIAEAGGRLYLTGLGEEAIQDVINSGKPDLTGPVRAYGATPIVGESTRQAIADAERWLADRPAVEPG
ncbi:MAG TPA: SulP family inorganic anion transporter [Chloroflexota bacterium]|nr:SulP family inorganic anion transporter [Chloroflexota bacterium]